MAVEWSDIQASDKPVKVQLDEDSIRTLMAMWKTMMGPGAGMGIGSAMVDAMGVAGAPPRNTLWGDITGAIRSTLGEWQTTGGDTVRGIFGTGSGPIPKDLQDTLIAELRNLTQVQRESVQQARRMSSIYDRPETALHGTLLQSMYRGRDGRMGVYDKLHDAQARIEYEQLNSQDDRVRFIQQRYSEDLASQPTDAKRAVRTRHIQRRLENPTALEQIDLVRDLIMARPDMSITKGLSGDQYMDLAHRMVLGGFVSPEGVRMRDPASDKDISRRKVQYVTDMAGSALLGTALFETEDIGQALGGMNLLRMGSGAGGSIYQGTRGADLEDKLTRVLGLGRHFNVNNRSIVEGMLQAQTALDIGAGRDIDIFTGRRQGTNTFETALRAEHAVQAVAQAANRRDPQFLQDTRSYITGMIGITGASMSGQQLNVASLMAQRDPSLAHAADTYRKLLSEQGPLAADAYFRSNIRGGMSDAEYNALAKIAGREGVLDSTTRTANMQLMMRTGATEVINRAASIAGGEADVQGRYLAGLAGVSTFISSKELGNAQFQAMMGVAGSDEERRALTAAYRRGGIGSAIRVADEDPAFAQSRERMRVARVGAEGGIISNRLDSLSDAEIEESIRANVISRHGAGEAAERIIRQDVAQFKAGRDERRNLLAEQTRLAGLDPDQRVAELARLAASGDLSTAHMRAAGETGLNVDALANLGKFLKTAGYDPSQGAASVKEGVAEAVRRGETINFFGMELEVQELEESGMLDAVQMTLSDLMGDAGVAALGLFDSMGNKAKAKDKRHKAGETIRDISYRDRGAYAAKAAIAAAPLLEAFGAKGKGRLSAIQTAADQSDILTTEEKDFIKQLDRDSLDNDENSKRLEKIRSEAVSRFHGLLEMGIHPEAATPIDLAHAQELLLKGIHDTLKEIQEGGAISSDSNLVPEERDRKLVEDEEAAAGKDSEPKELKIIGQLRITDKSGDQYASGTFIDTTGIG